MPQVTIGYGVLLILLGVISYYSTGRVSVTALIPAFFGLPVLICGLLALKQRLLKHAMHAAAMLGVLGILGTVGGAIKYLRMLGGAEVARPEAVTAQAVMCLLSLIFVILCVRSFIQVRRQRQAAGG